MKVASFSCSNLVHYKALVERALTEKSLKGICKVFNFTENGQMKRVEVDIVSQGGGCWIKVKAMKAQSVHRIYDGTSTHGHKSIISLAKDMLACSQHHLIHYTAPMVAIYFAKGVTEGVAVELQTLGVHVQGPLIDYEPMEEDEEDEEEEELAKPTKPTKAREILEQGECSCRKPNSSSRTESERTFGVSGPSKQHCQFGCNNFYSFVFQHYQRGM